MKVVNTSDCTIIYMPNRAYYKILKSLGIACLALAAPLISFNTSAFVSDDTIYFGTNSNSEVVEFNYYEPILSTYTSQLTDISSTFIYHDSFIEDVAFGSSYHFGTQQKSSYVGANDFAINTIGLVTLEAMTAFVSYSAATGYGNNVIGGTQLVLGLIAAGQASPLPSYTLATLGAYNLINDVERERDTDGDRKVDKDVFMINFITMNLLWLGDYAGLYYDSDPNQHIYIQPDSNGSWFINYNYKF